MSAKNLFSLTFLVAICQMSCSNLEQGGPSVPATAGARSTVSQPTTIHPESWPRQQPVMLREPGMEQDIAELLRRMTLEEKVGQIIQADIGSVTPEQVREYKLGSVLNGGSSAPGGDNRTTPDKWLALADEFWAASTDTSDGGVGIPAIWGTDAVHGHSNVLGATVFPHNIGLGMASDPELLYRIGRATALEMRVTGLDWTFAPTIAVARNDRWGRTYESYSEDPRIVAAYSPRIIEGIQGILGTNEFLGDARMIATAKHFAGDGATTGGRDQGDTFISEEDLRDVQAAGYPPAINAGVQSVMASFNSYHGRKLHGHKAMLTDVLVGRMGFDGFVVGDWNGHGQVRECSNTSCAASINAGLDMFMAPDSWQELFHATLAQVRSGAISKQRLDEAVARILRVKMRAGVFEAGPPSSRAHAGEFSLLASAEHRTIARESVRKSLVLLKNKNGVLPIPAMSNVLVAGDGAHNIGKQCGGWTLSWQGTGNLNEHFPNGTSIYEGLNDALSAAGGRAILSPDGAYVQKPDVAVVVFGEEPYAEFQGDRPNVDYDSNDGLALLRRFAAAGIPTVSVFLSGRPLWVNPEINASDAFVAAWLPGSEGGGVADVLVARPEGSPRYDFHGRLSFSWPKSAAQVEVNVGDEPYDPLFAYGYGLGYSDNGALAPLSEDSGLSSAGANGVFVEYGDPVGIWRMFLRDGAGDTRFGDSRGVSAAGNLQATPADRQAQEDTILLTWTGAASLVVDGLPTDFAAATAKLGAMELSYRVVEYHGGTVALAMGAADRRGTLDVTREIAEQAGSGWRTARIGLSCFEERGAAMASISEALVISAGGALQLQVAGARVIADPGDARCGL